MLPFVMGRETSRRVVKKESAVNVYSVYHGSSRVYRRRLEHLLFCFANGGREGFSARR